MKNPKISVIVPVYNVENYLPRCVNSILVQTFTDFELLLIDDGSKDCSGKICDEYAKKDNRIRVFHKENEGISSSRQLGIDNAKGEFSIHIDSDDWVEKNMLEEMYSEVVKTTADIVSFDYYHNSQYIKEEHSSKSIQVIYDILSGKNRGVMWNKIVRHSLYKENAIVFPKNINFCEDVYVCTLLYMHTDKIAHISKAYYHYMDNPNSITRSLTKSIIKQRAQFVQEVSKILIDNKLDTKCLLWHKMDLKWLMFDSHYFSYREYKSYFNEIFSSYSYKRYPCYLKNMCILYLVNYRCIWYVLRRIRK